MVDVREPKCHLLQGALSVQRMTARDSSSAKRRSHDRQSQRTQTEMDKDRHAKKLYVFNFH